MMTPTASWRTTKPSAPVRSTPATATPSPSPPREPTSITAACTRRWWARSSSLASMLAGARAEATETHAPAERRREALVVTPPTPPPSGAPLSPDEARRFREVVLRHADAAYNLALRLARREDVAEDIVHDAYVRALAAFPSLRGDGRSWILTIVRNRFYDWIREQRLRSTLPLTRPANSDDDGETDWDPPDLEQD